ncbi:MAG: sigma 54-interacting transcriptional regulator [Candidatus Wallbacteria bacterium]|nr:sigma 54-interacting transcriptional regulator [Candidatus Wallbacteria bacterium]
MLGCTPAEWMESARALWLEFLSPLDRDRVQAEICGEGGTRGSWDVEYRMQPRSGGEIWVRDTARIITRPDGSREIVGIARDITDWKAGEQALRRRARQDEALVRIAKMALSGRSPAVLSDEAVRLVRDTLETDSALLLERVPECEYAIVRASAGLPPGRPAPDVAPIPPGSQLHFVIHSASPVSTEDLKSETRFAPSPTLLEMGVRGYLGVGLGGGRGSLSVSSVRCRRFSLEDAAFLQSVAGIFSMGLQRERAEKQLSALTEQLQALVASTSLLMNLASVSDAATVSEVLRNTGGDDAGGPVSVEELLSRLSASAKLLSPAALSRPATAARQALAGGDGFVASSPSMQRLLEQVAMVSRTRAPVLLLGETGTGKERIARLLHENSPRTAGPFVPVDCCALAESVLDSELFGHAAGAFTGAAKARSGLIEAAAGGTLFLDEIGDITAAVQSKLLRVLQKSEVRRIGENLGRKIDVRFVAATNRDLVALVREKKFREDLYYRLNVVTLRLPPVRERREDIPLLLSHFLDRATTECGKPARGFSKAALHRAMNHPWPGNVREVENRIRSATILGGGERIDELDLFPVVGPERLQLGRAASGDVTLDLESAGLQHVLRVLESCSNDRRLTARSLGVSLRTLQYKLSRCRAAGFPVPG